MIRSLIVILGLILVLNACNSAKPGAPNQLLEPDPQPTRSLEALPSPEQLKEMRLSPQAVAGNRVQNPDFEAGTTSWNSYGSGYTIDATGGRGGSKAIKLTNPGGQNFGASQQINLNQTSPQSIYFCGYSKAQGVTGSRDVNYSIYLDIGYTDGTYLFGRTLNFAVNTPDWQFLEATIQPAKPVLWVRYYTLLRPNHTGTVWFDDVCLTSGSTPPPPPPPPGPPPGPPPPSGSNLLQNPGFESGSTAWTSYSSGFGLDASGGRGGGQAVKLTNPGGQNFGARQVINLNQTSPKPIYFCGYSKAQGVSGSPDVNYSIYLDIGYTDGTYLFGRTLNFAIGTHDWQFLEATVQPAKPIAWVRYYVLLRPNHIGTVWFDDLCLSDGSNPPPPPPPPPPGITPKYEIFASSLGGVPWSLDFSPAGELFFTLRNRSNVEVRQMNLSTKQVTTFAANPATSVRQGEGEGGVLGMALDTDFASNKKFYICYSYYKNNTVSDANKRNRLSSFVLSGGALTSETILLDDMLGWSSHNGCRVVIGPDGMLYIAMGDAAQQAPGGSEKAQDKTALAGKIFRISTTGAIPSDNPYFDTLSGSARALWTYGHRNPQGLAFQPGTNLLWSTEHGQSTRDELNLIVKGKNYGWPRCIGQQALNTSILVASEGTTYTCSGPELSASSYQAATAEYDSSVTVAMSDMMFYQGSAFPAWQGNLFFVALKTGRLYRLVLNGQQVGQQEILINNQYGRLRDVTFSPADGHIYISTDSGQIVRVLPSSP